MSSQSNEWEQIATVCVDSGQLMLIDPLYIDEHWKHEPFQDIRQYRHKTTGEQLQYCVDFDHYEQVIDRFKATMNQLLSSGEWQEVQQPIPPGLSYLAACRTTFLPASGGQLGGLAAVFSAGYGDGECPVLVKRNAEGRIMQVLIDFNDSPYAE